MATPNKATPLVLGDLGAFTFGTHGSLPFGVTDLSDQTIYSQHNSSFAQRADRATTTALHCQSIRTKCSCLDSILQRGQSTGDPAGS